MKMDLMSKFYILVLIDTAYTVRVVKLSLSDGMVPEKGSDISMTCDFETTASDGIQTLKILKGQERIASCYIYEGGSLPCSKEPGVSARYTFTNSQSSVIISITDLQISDAGIWYCGFALLTGSTLYTLSVYSTPVSIVLNGSYGPGDLSMKGIDLTCRTSNCIYPAPGNIQWFYKKETSWLPYQNLSASPSQSTCSGNEKIYSSTLRLPRYTVWPLKPTNTDVTVKFHCRLNFPTRQSPLISADSNNVQYAVRVTSVFLSDGNRNLTSADEITIITGSRRTFTCTTSISRPAATIVWYIGTTVQQRSTSSAFTYTAKYEEHNKSLSCKAFNIQNEAYAVSSHTPRLNVLVKVTSVTLTDGSASSPSSNDVIEVTENNLKTLTCITGEVNPAAIIMWFIGSDIKQNGTDKNFSFRPTNANHDKRIFCKAYNTQPPDIIESAKPKLFVKALIPSLTNWTSGSPDFYSGEQVTLVCKSTPTRPAVTVRWKKGAAILQNVQDTTSENSVKLFTVTSAVTFIPEKGDNNNSISCEMYIPNQSPQKVTKSIAVWWSPSLQSIPKNSFPWLEGQQGKTIKCHASDYGNPNSDVKWASSIGTAASKSLNLPVLTQEYDGENVSCQLINKYTQKMNDIVQSSVIQFNIMYKPDIFIHIGGVETYSIERNEGESLTAICSAKGNPKPSVKWQGRTSGNAKLEFTDIDRTDNGVYHCSGMATASFYPNYDFSNETFLNVTVNYAPNVTINLSNSNLIENTQLRIRCFAIGRPNTYTYISIIQTWRGVKVPNSHKPTNGIIEIDKLQLQDSGTYTCLVNNGIYDRNNQLDQMAKINVLVKVSPKVLHVGENKFAGAVGTSVNITIPFYSYPDINSVEFRFENGSKIINSDKHKIFYSKTTVEYMFYDQKVELYGYVALLYIINEDESDFSNYTLVLQNGIAQPTEWIFKHVSESIPSPPERFNFDGIVKGVPTFTFIGGFNGGSEQTFIVETAIHGTQDWKEQKRFNENDIAFQTNESRIYSFNLTGLSPNKYDVRVLAENSLGRIEERRAISLEFTVLYEAEATASKSFGVEIAVGVTVPLVSIIAFVIAVVVVKKRYRREVKVTSVTLADGSASSPSSNDVIEVTENSLKTLTCKTGEVNPAAIIMWFIGSYFKQNGTDKNFSFRPTNVDHDKRIFCKAYNTQPPDIIESAKPKLFVKVLALIPSLTNWTSGSPDFYSGEQVTLVCKSTPTRPAVTVRWKKGAAILQNVQDTTSENSVKLFTVTSAVTFIPEKGDNNKSISCEMYIPNQSPQKVTKSIAVWWPPSLPSIPTNSFPWLEGQQGKTIKCHASDYGNPNSDVKWASSIGTAASKSLNLPVLTQEYDGENVSCQLINKYTQKMNDIVQSSVIQFNIMYKPDIFIHIGGVETYSIERNEGESLTAICSAKGNPKPSVKWQGRTSGNAKLEFTDIDRTDNGVYHCSGMATASFYPNYDFSNETFLNVTVNYAPNVTINLSNSNLIENTQLRIRCFAIGRPNTYTYTSMIQTWRGIKVPNSHKPTNGIIEIDKLQLQDSGTYTCLVNNGIYDRNNQLDQMAKINVLVKVSPKVLHVGENKFAGAVGTSVNIIIPFYSYPDINSVEFRFGNGSKIINSKKHKIFYSKTTVEYMFYEQKIELDGYLAMLYIINEDESDFSNYTLVLQNGIAQPTEWIFKHVSESIPSPPERFNFDGIVKDVPTFTFIGGFNGGSDQTFIVETAIHGTQDWKEQKRFNENDIAFQTNESRIYSFNLTGLSPNKYDVRVLAENSQGRIEEIMAISLEFTVLYEAEATASKSYGVEIAVGVTVPLVSIIAFVIAVVVVKKRYRKEGQNDGKAPDEGTNLDYYNLAATLNNQQMSGQRESELPYEDLKGKTLDDGYQTYDRLQQTENEEERMYSTLTKETVAKSNDRDDRVYENLKL